MVGGEEGMMTPEEAIKVLRDIKLGIFIDTYFDEPEKSVSKENEALDMAIKALEQQQRDCNTCKHSDNGNCAYTEECHECMWKSKYEQQPCEDCVSRKLLSDNICEGISCNECSFNEIDGECGCLLQKRFDELPSVQPTRPTGKWIAGVDRWGDIATTVNGYRCSECCAFNADKDNFCPNCGAKMAESEEEE